ncbi:MAG TPA: acyl-CoA thioesterase [Thermoleophilaceae bacterium]
MEPRPPSASSSVLSRWMGIGDANLGGNVHGGVIMHLCDEVAGIAAVRHSGRRAVTAAMDRMNFVHPVYVGQLVTVKAMVNAPRSHLHRLPHDGCAGRRGPPGRGPGRAARDGGGGASRTGGPGAPR